MNRTLFIFMLLVSMIGLIVSIVYYVIETKKNEKDQDPNVVRDSKIGIIVSSVILFLSSVLYLIYSRKTKPSENVEYTLVNTPPSQRRLFGYDTEDNTPNTQDNTPNTQDNNPNTSQKNRGVTSKIRLLEFGKENIVIEKDNDNKYSGRKYKNEKMKPTKK